MCGGFTCSKRFLIALNTLFIVVSFLLISAAIYGRVSVEVVDLPIVDGIFLSGVFLLLIAIFGLIGAFYHNQAVLFFYMILLFVLFLVQCGVASACLAVTEEQQREMARKAWTENSAGDIQRTFHCCGLDDSRASSLCPNPSWGPCLEKLQSTIGYAFKLCGSIGLVFSFAEFVGVFLTVRYRNQKDPRPSASAFL